MEIAPANLMLMQPFTLSSLKALNGVKGFKA